MAPVVDLKVQDLAKAVTYYESLLSVNLQGPVNGSALLVGDQVSLKLSETAGKADAQTNLTLTSGMLARVLDVASGGRCPIEVTSPEVVQLTDKFGHKWTLQCHLT